MKILCRLEPGARPPAYAKAGDAGADLRVSHSSNVGKGQRRALHTGVALSIPEGYVGILTGRSGLSRKGVHVATGIIDSGYRGSIGITLTNNGDETLHLRAGDRVAQLLIMPVVACEFVGADELDETERGEGGFGSSGR